MQRDIVIQCPDGQMKTVPLQGDRLTVGRSSAAELCFPGRRRPFAPALWSSNPTATIGRCRISAARTAPSSTTFRCAPNCELKPGDRITAGHLAIVFDDRRAARPARGVVVFDGGEPDPPSTSTIWSPAWKAPYRTSVVDPAAAPSPRHAMQALIRAGQELAENRPLADLFPLILDLSIQAVNAQRGVLLLLEGDQLAAKAHKGDGFRISHRGPRPRAARKDRPCWCATRSSTTPSRAA